MSALVVLVLSVAALDSLNPSTLVPAVVLALGEHSVRRLSVFTAGVFVVSTAGGLAATFALGSTVLSRAAHPSAQTRHALELAAGIALLCIAAVLWAFRKRLRAHLTRPPRTGGRSAFLLGAGVMAIELPTAFPYFAAIVATLAAVRGATARIAFILLYNVVFVLPLLALAALVAVTGRRYETGIARTSVTIRELGPTVLPIGLAVIGAVLAFVGARGL